MATFAGDSFGVGLVIGLAVCLFVVFAVVMLLLVYFIRCVPIRCRHTAHTRALKVHQYGHLVCVYHTHICNASDRNGKSSLYVDVHS